MCFIARYSFYNYLCSVWLKLFTSLARVGDFLCRAGETEMRGESQLLVTEGGGKPKEDAEEESQQLVSPYGDGISISSKDAGKLLGADGGGIFLTARHAERLGADGNGNNTDGNSVLKDAGLEESEQLLGPADTSQRAEELQQLLGPNVDGDGKPCSALTATASRCSALTAAAPLWTLR